MKLLVHVQSIHPGMTDASAVLRSFVKGDALLGRAPDNDLVLAEPEVSGRHAKFFVRQQEGRAAVFIEDLGSSNGTFLEDRRLDAHVETEVLPGQRVIVGNFLLVPSVEEDLVREQAPKGAKKDAQAPSGRESAAKAADQQMDLFEQEIKVKHLIHHKLIERLDLRRKDIIALSDEDLRKRAQHVVEQILVDLRWEIPSGLDRDGLIGQILDEALGLGPLETLLSDDSVSEIMVNNYFQIYVERGGRIELTGLRFSSEEAVLAAIERVIAPIGRRVDESSPLVDARLKDGSRVNAVIRPLALRGPCITIRKFAKVPLSIQDLVRFGSLSQGMADFLEMAVKNRLNVVISGGTGSGKTTLLNVISGFIPGAERVITVEDAAELRLSQEHVVSFETRPPNLEGKGAITIRDLVRNALRMRPDRIIVGECRGAEALDMLQAMNTGHDGSMTTAHANSPADMVRRLETMVLTAGLDLPVRAVREQIASAIDIILQQTRFSCGTRLITAISEVVGMDYEEGTVQLQDIFQFRQDGYDSNGKISGHHQATGYVPKFFRSLQERGLPVNAEVFSPGKR